MALPRCLKEAVLDVSFKARNLEISNAKIALEQLKIQSPLLAESLLFGTVKDLSMQITGPVSTPAITMSCSPDNIAFEPLGTRQAHASSRWSYGL